METQAYFSGIREKIIASLGAAQESVLVAVAWLTDRELFDALVACQRRGVPVSLAVLDDRINRKSSIAWERLTALGGKHYWIPDGTNRAGSLHHKFCLIDGDTVINGSFNWTNRASNADENIVVLQGDTEFADQFRQAFDRLLDKHGHDVPQVPIDKTKLLARLAVIGKLLELEDYEDVPAQAQKIGHAKNLPEIAALICQLCEQEWAAALAAIRDILTKGLAITVYQDPRIEEWRWQVRVLEAQAMALEAELADMQRRIHLFDYQQEKAIGELIREYLDIKRRVLRAQYKRTGDNDALKQAEAADDTYGQYEEARAVQAKEPIPTQLDAKQQADLKSIYRKLAQRCHPDKFTDEHRDWATKIFKDVADANRNNDLNAMRRLEELVACGPDADFNYNKVDQTDRLEARVVALQAGMQTLNRAIATIGASPTWQTLCNEADWGAWFALKAEKLRGEILRHQDELESLEAESAL